MNRRVIFLEINEITWSLIDPLIEQGKLPNFARLKREGAWASPISVDMPPQLNPWITWTTVYTGRTQAEHNLFHLQQPPETIRAPRIWELCNTAGLKVGVFGSLCSYPPQKVDGFYIPDSFSPDIDTFPAEAEPIQNLNLTYTRSIRLPNDSDGIFFKAKLGAQLMRLGLKWSTCSKIINQLGREKIDPSRRWRRVALQPEVNFDFFERLYRRHQPDFATFHTNHVAHFQHTYWKAMQPELFPQPTSDDESSVYGKAVEIGYITADNIIGRALELSDERTVLVIASSMGQKPYISPLENGKQVGQLRSLEKLAEILDIADGVKFLPVMSDQFNIYFSRSGAKDEVRKKISQAYVDKPELPMFQFEELDDFLTVTLNHSDEISDRSKCYFSSASRNGDGYAYSDLVHRTGDIKSGCHDPEGMLLLHGSGIRGGLISETNNLDIAPTILTLLGISVPAEMKGRVMDSALAS